MLDKLVNLLRPKRQILLFSATFPVTVRSFRDKYIPNPHPINLMQELTLRGVTQFYAYVREQDKIRCLHTLFSQVRRQ